MTIQLTLPPGESLVTGKQVTFESPCNSVGLTAVVVNEVPYDLVGALGDPLADNSFDAGAMISVIFNVERCKAYVQNADTNTYLENRLNSKQGKFITRTCTLTITEWLNNNTQTVPVNGVTADNDIDISPAPSSHSKYCESGVYCSVQANGSLTFACSYRPTQTLTVNVRIWDKEE